MGFEDKPRGRVNYTLPKRRHSVIGNTPSFQAGIAGSSPVVCSIKCGCWCSGSTTDCDSVRIGSNPVLPPMRRVRRAVKPPPFQGGNHEFKSRTRHQYARIAKLVMHLTFNQEILSVRVRLRTPFHNQNIILRLI